MILIGEHEMEDVFAITVSVVWHRGSEYFLLIFSQFQVEKLTLPKVGKAPSFALVTACPG